MRRPLVFLLTGALSLALLAVLALIKWNEPASTRRLENEIQARLYGEVRMGSTLRPQDIKISIASRQRQPPDWIVVKGTATISRRAFSLTHPNSGKQVKFSPSGETTIDFVAVCTLVPQHVSAAKWLGARRPTWSVGGIGTPRSLGGSDAKTRLRQAWKNALLEGDNAVFDSQMTLESSFRSLGGPNVREDAVFLVACRALTALDRPAEAALLAPAIKRRDELESLFGINVRQTITDYITAPAKASAP